jgi:high affinity sulfate transporter 1
MAATTPARGPRRVPRFLLQGLLPVGDKRALPDVLAGATLAALAIPEVLGYSRIAGMPIVTGLYTLIIPAVLFALFGSSRHLVVGADSATAAITFAALTPLALAGSPQYVGMACMLALIAGVLLLLARLLRLGFLANFLSRTVLIGFLTGVGISVAAGQLAGMFGLHKEGRSTAAHVYSWARDLTHTSPAAVLIAVSVIVLIVLGERWARRVPWALIAVVGTMVLSYAFSFADHGILTIGAIPRGLPSLDWPGVPFTDMVPLAGTAASLFIVIVAQSAATSRAYASKYEDRLDDNVDLVGLGLANLGAAFTGTYVVNGSPTKTAIVDEAGGRSQLSQLTAAAIAVLVLLFATGAMGYLPEAVLSAVVFLIGVKLIDWRGMRTVWRQRPVEFWVAVLTTATVVLVGVQEGIFVAIAASIVAHIRHSYHPYDRLLARFEGKVWKSLPLESGVQARKGLLIYRFGASLYYANASRFHEEVERLVHDAPIPIRWFCVAMESVTDVDFTATLWLERTVRDLQARGVTVVLCDVTEPVQAELRRDGLLDLVGEGNLFPDTDDVIRAYRLKTGIDEPPGAELADQPESATIEPAWWLPGANRRAIE